MSKTTRRQVLRSSIVGGTVVLSGCSDAIGPYPKVVEWKTLDEFEDETTFAVEVKNRGITGKIEVTIKLYSESRGNGLVLAEKGTVIKMRRGERRTVEITMNVPDEAESWIAHVFSA